MRTVEPELLKLEEEIAALKAKLPKEGHPDFEQIVGARYWPLWHTISKKEEDLFFDREILEELKVRIAACD